MSVSLFLIAFIAAQAGTVAAAAASRNMLCGVLGGIVAFVLTLGAGALL